MKKLKTKLPIGDNLVDHFSYLVIRKNAPVIEPKETGAEGEEEEGGESDGTSSEVAPHIVAKEWSRVLRPTLKPKLRVIVDVCDKSGEIQRRVITKKGYKEFAPEAYKEAKHIKWGQLWRFDKKPKSQFKRKKPKSNRRRLQSLRDSEQNSEIVE